MESIPSNKIIRLLSILEKNIRDGAKVSPIADPVSKYKYITYWNTTVIYFIFNKTLLIIFLGRRWMWTKIVDGVSDGKSYASCRRIPHYPLCINFTKDAKKGLHGRCYWQSSHVYKVSTA